ncbi:MAG TPA: hypothetical protein VFV75_05480 [Candidatus Polarisedimenticolaceae bacterium]|nr:hypothetical protein [Candidatus Polarisedimenticolaceae bacterium]
MAVKKARKKAASKTARKRSGTGVKARTKRAVRAVLVGAAAGALAGAVRGAAQAGSKEMGLRSAVPEGEGGTVARARPKRKAARTSSGNRGGATARRRAR